LEGKIPFMDFCPVYSGFDNGVCSDSDNEQYVKVSSIERFGAKNSRCLLGNLPSLDIKTALCLPIACVIEDRTLRIKLDRTWHVCKEAGQELEGRDVTVQCPEPRRICPTFYCPYDCLGTGGICDYPSGKCLCEYPGIIVDGKAVLHVCGLMELNETASYHPFLRPVKPDNENSAIPHPDSPLSDYYVPTSRALEDNGSRLMEPWAIALVCGVGAVLLSGALFIWEKRSSFFSSIGLFGSSEQPEGDGVVINRNKDKMIATFLVDMRMHHSMQDESLAETDEHLTESEVASGHQSGSMSDFSSRRSETLSEADVSQDEITEEDIHGGKEESMIVRRRHVNTNVQ
jgi:hypothetical protein